MVHINYKLIGKGKKTVLFLHGWGGNLNSFLFCFSHVPAEYKILTLDFIGFGESDKLKYCFSVFDYVTEVYKLLKKLDINEVSIVSHSFGGRVAILLESMFKIKVESMILADTAGVKPKFNLFNKLKILKFKFIKFLSNHKLIKTDINKYGSSDYKNLNQLEKSSFNKVVNFDETKYLKLINSKVLIYWGEKDSSTPLYMAKILNKQIKNSKLTVVKNADHFCYLTHKNIFIFELVNML